MEQAIALAAVNGPQIYDAIRAGTLISLWLFYKSRILEVGLLALLIAID